jgi:hypothetical protein
MKAPNGAIYVPLAPSETVLDVYKCSDPDSGSFSLVDSANNPSSGTGRFNKWSYGCQYEHLIFVVWSYSVSGEHDIRETTLNTATDLWEGSTRTIYSGGPGEIPSAWLPCYLVATPNYLYCLHPSDSEKVHGTPYARCMVSYRDLDGTTWNNSSEFNSGTGSPVEPVAVVPNSSENAVAISCVNNTVGDAVVWNRSSLGTPVQSNTGHDQEGCAQAVSYMDGSTNRIIVRLETTAGSSTKAWRLTSSGTTVTETALTEITTGEAGERGGLARWGTTLYAWLVNSSNNPAYSDSADHGANWSGPTQHSNPSNNVTEHPWANCYTRKGQLKIGIVYKEGTTQLSYDERSISNVSAPGFASARTPVRQNRIFVDA